MSRTVVVLNPTAGSGRAGRAWTESRAREPEFAALDVVLGESAAATVEALHDRLKGGGVDRVIAVGGDGTAHLVVNAVVTSGQADTVAFGLVAAGTGADFARGLGLPKRIGPALRRVLDAEARSVDVIEMVPDDPSVERRIVLNIASAGLSGQVVEEVASIDRGTYLGATIRALGRYRPRPCRVVADGEVLCDGRFFLLAIANGRYFGKGMHVAPRARLDDGLIDVVLARLVPGWQMPWLLPRFMLGRHLSHPRVTHVRAREVRIEPPDDFLPYELDGEVQPSVACTFRVLPGALRLLA
ncbi:MAG: diacylglycerol kinase family protein [Acidobacteriota bacterium]